MALWLPIMARVTYVTPPEARGGPSQCLPEHLNPEPSKSETI